MKKLLAVACLSLAAAGFSAGQAHAWLFDCCCCKYKYCACAAQYNAFSPFCLSTVQGGCCCHKCFHVADTGCCPPAPCPPPCVAGGCCPGGCCDGGACAGPDCGCGSAPLGQLPAAGQPPAGTGSPPNNFQPPTPQPLPTGPTSQAWPGSGPAVHMTAYRPNYAYYGQGCNPAAMAGAYGYGGMMPNYANYGSGYGYGAAMGAPGYWGGMSR